MNDECDGCGGFLPLRKSLCTEDGDYLCEDCFEDWMIEKAEKYDREEP